MELDRELKTHWMKRCCFFSPLLIRKKILVMRIAGTPPKTFAFIHPTPPQSREGEIHLRQLCCLSAPMRNKRLRTDFKAMEEGLGGRC